MTIKMKIKDNDEDREKPKVEIIKLSASSMKTYDQCPTKYYYNYIAKEPRKQWAHFDLGNLCHKALEVFHETYIKEGAAEKSLSQIMKYSFAKAREEYPDMTGNLVVEAKKLLADYLKNISSTGMPHVKGVETEFKFHLTDDILVRGFLDRIDIMKDGRFHILDYKTTENDRYLDDFQLLLYGLWLKTEYPDIDEFKASYVLLRHKSKLKSYTFNAADIKRCKKKVLSYAKQIKDSKEQNVWTPIPSKLCNYCDFKDICPTQLSW